MDALLAYWDRDPISFSIIAVVLAAVLAVALTNLRTPKQIYFNIDSAVDKMCLFLNVVAAAWIMMMAWVILVDVVTLALKRPIEGGREIIALSVITILFLQIPLAIRHGGMIRTTIVYDNVGPKIRDVIDVVS
ncbi:MAG: TRAP transporter small permease subunit [Alphaproteobacteria bacterium]|nr:TRAP transporter small permease subunit [Alphaproteobacteria bacterium]